ncbi:MAG: Methyltransferase type 11 [Parcubacteria group bacterium GW2011_GWA2_47_7]|nr:MAG: Methyltransferase type 11 [Parcubacteria group bacterium GW2011_GWA2_47_7]
MKIIWAIYAIIYDALCHLLSYQELLQRARVALQEENDTTSHVLDAGCGTGNFTKEYLDRCKNKNVSVECIDASPSMLRRAINKLRAYTNVHCARVDLNQPLPYPDAQFDNIVCLNALYATEDPIKVLGEFSRVLKFGGKLVLANPTKEARVRDVFVEHIKMNLKKGWAGVPIMMKGILYSPIFLLIFLINFLWIKRLGAKRLYHFLDNKELSELLKQAHFRVLRTEHAYGGTDVFIVASKMLVSNDKFDNPLVCEIAQGANDMAALYRLRYTAYCEEMGSLDPSQYPEKQESDKYDEFSTHVIVRCGDEIIGILRLIRDSTHGFLMEECFVLPDSIDRSRTVEHSRGIIKKEHRDRGIYTVLLRGAYLWQREHGFITSIGAPRVDKLSLILLQMGWETIGEPSAYHNVVVVPMAFTLHKEAQNKAP